MARVYSGTEFMPWAPSDAEKHTSKADTPRLQRVWAQVANSALERTGDEGRAIREANSAVARQQLRHI